MATTQGINWKEMTWPMAVLVLALLCLTLILFILSGGDHLAERAFDKGRRVAFTLSDGSMLGNPFFTPEAEKSEEMEEPDAAPETEVPAEAPDAPSPQPAAEEESHEDRKLPPAMAGNFVGEQLESQQQTAAPVLSPDESYQAEKNEENYDYPLDVKPDPQGRNIGTPAPSPQVKVRELLEEAKPGNSLPSAPMKELVEKTSQGDELPRISKDGLRPWQAYAKPFKAGALDPLVSVIIADLGVSRHATLQALKLDQHFTFSFSPYGEEVEMWMRTARSIGHEALLDLPMQLEDFPASDPGPQGQRVSIANEDNVKRLHWVMSRVQGYVGMLAPVGASMPEGSLRPALSEIAGRGLLFARQPGAIRTAAQDGNSGEKLGLVEVDIPVLVDDEVSEAAISARLDELVALAKKNGHAVGIARAYPITLEMLQAWHKTLEAAGVRLAPVSALAPRGGA